MKRRVLIVGGSYLRISIATVLIATGLSGCGVVCKIEPGEWDYCKQEIMILNSTSKVPEFNLNPSFGSDSIRKQLSLIYDLDYLSKNAHVKVAVPIGSYTGNFLLDVNFVHGSKVSDSSSTPIQLRPKYLQIMINPKNHLLVNGDFSIIDSVYTLTKRYFAQVANNDDYPSSFSEARIIVRFEKCSQSFLQSILELISSGYLDALAECFNRDLCNLSNRQITQIKEEYPLLISLIMEPMSTNIEEIEIQSDPERIKLRTE